MNIQPSLFDAVEGSGSDQSLPSARVLGGGLQIICLEGAHLAYFPGWLRQTEVLSTITSPRHQTPNEDMLAAKALVSTEAIFQALKKQVAWEQTSIRLYGKAVRIPRLNAWYAQPQYGYTYSGQYFTPHPWLSVLLSLKLAIEQQIQTALLETSTSLTDGLLNSALVNCYRDGQDSVAWHSDDEPELGNHPTVASVSLGAERIFQLRHKHHKGESYRYSLPLQDGDLLIMYGATQHNWQHQLPKTRHKVGERINITYRQVRHPRY
ncbi:alpha-ketoglutarate-dependent dioxygenase AlkB family protein [Eionea flava]